MKLVFLIAISLFYSITSYAQEVYLNTLNNSRVVSLSCFNGEGDLKVLEGEKITYVRAHNLEQTDQFSFEQFIEYIFDHKLAFICSGGEPFWQATLSKESITGLFVNTKTDKKINYSHAYSLGWGWYVMFGSNDGQLYGIIRRADLTCKDCTCGNSEYTESETLFECYISFEGKAYTGCAIIDKTE